MMVGVSLCSALAGSAFACRGGSTLPRDSMKEIIAGTFTMGCIRSMDPTCSDTEEPAHEVTLATFYIDTTEVTRAAYKQCVAAGSCSPPPRSCADESWDASSLAQYPMTCVDWEQARAFCAWRGLRLPGEAEWERAARGGDGRIYPWGNSKPTCRKAIHAPCGEVPREVGGRPAGASPYGVLDMAGNVSEWVADKYAAYGHGTATNGRVVRDDANDAWHMRVTSRGYLVPSYRERTVGFRCARSSK